MWIVVVITLCFTIYDVLMNYSDALYFVLLCMRPNMGGGGWKGDGGALGNHVLLLTSRKFSLMTSRGNSCSMVTNNDDPRIVRADSMRASERGGNKEKGETPGEGWQRPLSRARHLPAIGGSAGRRPPWRRRLAASLLAPRKLSGGKETRPRVTRRVESLRGGTLLSLYSLSWECGYFSLVVFFALSLLF